MEKISLIDVCERIIELEKQNRDERSKPGLYVRESMSLLADCRDYCVFRVFDALRMSAEEVEDLVGDLIECRNMCSEWEHDIYGGFFFALAKLLSLEHKDKVQDFSSTDRKAFEERWAKTRSELGL